MRSPSSSSEGLSGAEVDVIDEIAADVVRRNTEPPDLPAVDDRLLPGEERALHLSGDLDLVLGEQLVLELEHQDDQEQEEPPGPEIEPHGQAAQHEFGPPQDRQDQRAEQQGAPRRSQLEQQAAEQPAQHPEGTPRTTHGLEPPPALPIEVEPVQVSDVPTDRSGEVGAPQVGPHHRAQVGALGGVGWFRGSHGGASL